MMQQTERKGTCEACGRHDQILRDDREFDLCEDYESCVAIIVEESERQRAEHAAGWILES